MNYVKGIEDTEKKRAEREAILAERGRKKLISHVVGGAVAFSLMPGLMIFAVAGAIAGYVISSRYPSVLGGLLCGTLALMGVLVIFHLVGGTLGIPELLSSLGIGLLLGGMPGAFVGLHASVDY